MKISEVINFNDLLKMIDSYDLVLFAHTLYKDQVNLFTEIKNKCKNILVIVGPEGGFDDKEVEKLIKYSNLKPVSLGKRILRTETAPLYIMSVLGFIGEQYDN
jgi:16S rRNA (uracil1498-N3)-methyltransferase